MSDLADLERDVEESRARLESSLQRLREELTPTSLAGEILGMLSGGDVSGIRRSARQLALKHPVPLLVLGLGLSWAYWRTGRPPQTWGRRDFVHRPSLSVREPVDIGDDNDNEQSGVDAAERI